MLQYINGQVKESVGIGSNYEYKYGNAQICVLLSVAKKKVTVASVSSTESFSMVGLALQVKEPTVVANIPGLKVGEED
jgi:hypothetical protein